MSMLWNIAGASQGLAQGIEGWRKTDIENEDRAFRNEQRDQQRKDWQLNDLTRKGQMDDLQRTQELEGITSGGLTEEVANPDYIEGSALPKTVKRAKQPVTQLDTIDDAIGRTQAKIDYAQGKGWDKQAEALRTKAFDLKKNAILLSGNEALRNFATSGDVSGFNKPSSYINDGRTNWRSELTPDGKVKMSYDYGGQTVNLDPMDRTQATALLGDYLNPDKMGERESSWFQKKRELDYTNKLDTERASSAAAAAAANKYEDRQWQLRLEQEKARLRGNGGRASGSGGDHGDGPKLLTPSEFKNLAGDLKDANGNDLPLASAMGLYERTARANPNENGARLAGLAVKVAKGEAQTTATFDQNTGRWTEAIVDPGNGKHILTGRIVDPVSREFAPVVPDAKGKLPEGDNLVRAQKQTMDAARDNARAQEMRWYQGMQKQAPQEVAKARAAKPEELQLVRSIIETGIVPPMPNGSGGTTQGRQATPDELKRASLVLSLAEIGPRVDAAQRKPNPSPSPAPAPARPTPEQIQTRADQAEMSQAGLSGSEAQRVLASRADYSRRRQKAANESAATERDAALVKARQEISGIRDMAASGGINHLPADGAVSALSALRRFPELAASLSPEVLQAIADKAGNMGIAAGLPQFANR